MSVLRRTRLALGPPCGASRIACDLPALHAKAHLIRRSSVGWNPSHMDAPLSNGRCAQGIDGNDHRGFTR